uniref:Integrase, catalytic region, zinc finger, CCHC-type, peptidase aspartic, catalytic n=1 Tax=Tanacetum cinerariifolium TaxID=118510 RepID=A0A699INA4_TANCI|nr:hypothetical protein [Tanacetum cinerariifolium]
MIIFTMATMAENMIVVDSIKNGPYNFKSEITIKDTYGVTDIRRAQRPKDLVEDDKLHYESDIKAVIILFLGLLVDIYSLINHYQTTKVIWDRVKELIEGTKMTKKEHESMLYDKFDKFPSEPGESIYSYYLRFAKLINDMNMIPMSMKPMQINTKFVNHLQSEWSRFVTVAKQARSLHSCTAKKRVKDSEWFKDKKLHDQVQKAGVVLDEEEQDFLADSLEKTDDYEDLQLQATINFKAYYFDAYDSDCDDEATTHVIFMEKLCHVGSLKNDTISPCYNFDTLFEEIWDRVKELMEGTKMTKQEGMSILKGRKSVPGMNSSEREMERGYYSVFT